MEGLYVVEQQVSMIGVLAFEYHHLNTSEW
jgi:hypothetical protein